MTTTTELSPETAEPASFTVQDAWESIAIACALGQDIPAVPGTCVYQPVIVLLQSDGSHSTRLLDLYSSEENAWRAIWDEHILSPGMLKYYEKERADDLIVYLLSVGQASVALRRFKELVTQNYPKLPTKKWDARVREHTIKD